MRGKAFGIGLVMVVAACAPVGGGVPPVPTATGLAAAPSTAAPSPSSASRSSGLDTDEPCTATVPAGTAPLTVAFRAEDLPRMVLDQADFEVTGLQLTTWEDPGFQGNDELQSIDLHPPTLCDDTVRFGRLNGYGTSYGNIGDYQTSHYLSSAVHLFADAAGARGWNDAFITGLQRTVGMPGGPTRLDVQPIDGLPSGSSSVTYEGPAGARTWAMVVDGPVVGWVVDRHDTLAPSEVDVVPLARALAERIRAVSSEVATRPRDGLDIAGLQSAPLRLADYGDRYAGLEWDEGRGGLTEADELGCASGDPPPLDPGRVSGAAAVFGPPSGTQMSEIVRVYSSVEVMRDAASASASLADLSAERIAAGGRPFDAGTIGDERLGIVTPPHEASGGCRILYTETRVTTRIDDLLATVVIQDRGTGDRSEQVAALAATLTDRVRTLLTGTSSD